MKTISRVYHSLTPVFVLFISYFQLNQTIEAVKEELAKEKNLSDKSQKELETDLVSTKHR